MDTITKTDVVQIFKLLATLFPQSARNYEGADALTRDAWYELIKDMPRQLVVEAIKSYAASHVWAPSIAELRAEVLKAANPDLRIDADEAWGLVVQAIRKYGYTRPQEALASLPEPVARCARRFGWRELCLSEEPDVVRGQFRRAYETQFAREKTDALIPAHVQQRLALLTGNSGNIKALGEGDDD